MRYPSLSSSPTKKDARRLEAARDVGRLGGELERDCAGPEVDVFDIVGGMTYSFTLGGLEAGTVK